MTATSSEALAGKFYSVHGFCSSPILYKDMVIVNGDQDAKAYLVAALDTATGARRWRTDRPNRTHSYCARSSWTPPARSSSC